MVGSILHYLALYCTILHYLALSCTIQGYIFRLTCSHPEQIEDHVLTSAYVKIFRTVTKNAVNKSVWRKRDCSWLPLNKHAMNIWLSSLRIREHLSCRTGKHLHVLHVLISTFVKWIKLTCTVLWEPEHGSLRARARFSENQITVLREPDQSTVLRKHLHVLHVLRTYSTCSCPGQQDTTTYAALCRTRSQLILPATIYLFHCLPPQFLSVKQEIL